jgi:Family of unknown function (DUF5681)
MKRKPPRGPGDGPYEIGYCKPPKRTRFKPGQSGNPRGRPKAEKSLGAALNDALKAKVKLRGNGKERGVSSRDAYFIRVVRDAIQGNAAAQRLLLALMERFLPINAAAPAENAEDARAEVVEKIELMRKRLLEKPPDEK